VPSDRVLDLEDVVVRYGDRTVVDGAVAAICGWYADRKSHLSDLYASRRTLEEVFLTLSGAAVQHERRRVHPRPGTGPSAATGTATVLYVLMLTVSGVMFPLPELGRTELLNPLAAYAETLRQTLSSGLPAQPWAWYGLGLWALLSVYAAALWFRWE
jgi:hypothetical protein